jgi:hypothetical protein
MLAVEELLPEVDLVIGAVLIPPAPGNPEGDHPACNPR